MRYKVSKVDYRESSDEVAIILKSEEDSFAVWLPREEFERLDINELRQLLHERIRERVKLLKKKRRKTLTKKRRKNLAGTKLEKWRGLSLKSRMPTLDDLRKKFWLRSLIFSLFSAGFLIVDEYVKEGYLFNPQDLLVPGTHESLLALVGVYGAVSLIMTVRSRVRK